jgi:putative multiple sugar transport system substrate-binding protein
LERGKIMKKYRKLIVFATVLMLLLATVTGCGTDGTDDDGNGGNGGDGSTSIGIVLPTKDEPRWVQDETRFNEALADTDYSVEILFSQGSSASEKANVESLLTKGIDVLIICPHDGDAAAAAAEAAAAEGVTVISYDRLITGTDAVDYYVTFDSIAVGAAQGQYLVEQCVFIL